MKTEWKRILLMVLTVILSVSILCTAGAGIKIYEVWCDNQYFFELNLRGEEEITVFYGTEFEDPGAEAHFWGTHLLKEVQQIPVIVEGTVDTSVLGTYELRYYAMIGYKDLFWDRVQSRYAKRTVHVVDKEFPVITLLHVEGYYTLPGQTYVEEGYAAYDEYDGDLTDRVEITTDGKTVTYSVTDSSGNTASVTRTIFYDDPIAPEMVLTGEETITIMEGDAFTDPGCTASDNCDGDLTAGIVVEGAVDANVPGTYTLTYTVSDAWGNESSTQRTVVVEAKPTEPPPTEPPDPVVPDVPLPPNGKVIYLTFDDGPGPYTARLLDILAQYNVKATFFVVHTGYMDLLPRMAQEGHTIAMHAYNHDYSVVYASDSAYLEDLQKIQNEILSYTGQTSTIVRFPGGTSNSVSRQYCPGIMTRMSQKLKDMGYRYFDWNVDSNDAGGAYTAHRVYCNVANSIAASSRSTFVVLQHDIWGYSVNAVEDIIIWGLANGYSFAALDMYSPPCEHWLNN